MSDRTTSVVESQDPTPESAVVEQVQASAEQAAQEEERLLREADSTCKAAVRAFRRGEQEYRKGLLEAGRLADLYVHQRIALKHPRENAVKTLEGEFSRYASSSVDVDRLIRCYHAYRLLAEETGVKADNVPFGQWRDAWCQLVERQDKGQATESWIPLQDFEDRCRELFAECVKSAMPTEGVKQQVRELLHKYAGHQADKARAEAEAKRQAEEQAKAAANEAEDQVRRAETEARALAEAEAKANDDEKARLTEAKRQAEEELRQKQREYAERVAKAEAETAAKRRAEREAQEKARAEQRAADKLTRPIPAPKPKDGPQESRAENLLKTAKNGTAKDVAAMAAELVTGGDAPDDVFEELLRLLKTSGELSKSSIRAIDAAMLVLSRDKKQPTAA
jgi:hypothetical protein